MNLIEACISGNVDFISNLFEKIINEKDYMGNTALMIACAKGNIEIVKILLKYGVDTSLTQITGQTALDIARINGYTTIVKLLERPTNELKDSEIAYTENDYYHNFNEYDTEKPEMLPIIQARDFFERGAIMTDRVWRGETDTDTMIETLIVERESQTDKLSEKLFKGTVKVEPILKFDQIENKTLDIDLILRSASTNRELAKTLLDPLPDINIKNSNDETAIYIASESGASDVIEYLLEHGADPNITTKTEFGVYSPLDVAMKNQNTECINALVLAGSKSVFEI